MEAEAETLSPEKLKGFHGTPLYYCYSLAYSDRWIQGVVDSRAFVVLTAHTHTHTHTHTHAHTHTHTLTHSHTHTHSSG